MTDPRPPLSDDDLSAALDGHADPDVMARLADDPDAQARMGELRAAADAVAAPVEPLAPDVVDRLIAQALAETPVVAGTFTSVGADPQDGGPANGVDDTVVAPLAPRGGRRAGPPTWLVAAVVAVVVAIGLGLVWSGTRSSDDSANQATARRTPAADKAASGFEHGSGAVPDGDSGATARGSDAGAAATTAAPPSGTAPRSPGATPATTTDLGAFASPAELRRTLASAFPTAVTRPSDGTAPTQLQLARCIQQVRTTLNGAKEPPPLPVQPAHQGYAQVASQRVVVFEFRTTTFQAGRSAVISAVGTDSCDPVLLFVR